MRPINSFKNNGNALIIGSQNPNNEEYEFESTDKTWEPAKRVIGSFPLEFMKDRNQPSWNKVSERTEL